MMLILSRMKNRLKSGVRNKRNLIQIENKKAAFRKRRLFVVHARQLE